MQIGFGSIRHIIIIENKILLSKNFMIFESDMVLSKTAIENCDNLSLSGVSLLVQRRHIDLLELIRGLPVSQFLTAYLDGRHGRDGL